MRKVLIVIAIILIGAAILSVYFGFRAWRALKPVIGTPPDDIVKVIEEYEPPAPGKEPAPFPLNLPKGFSISLFAKNLVGPRVMKWAPGGWLVVSEMGAGNVTALRDIDGDGLAETHKSVIRGLDRPHGVTFYEDFIYVAVPTGVWRYKFNPENAKVPVDSTGSSQGEKILDLPNGDGHFTRTIEFGAKDSTKETKIPELYVSIGSSCNVCREQDEERATIMVSDPDGKNARVFAKGLRNTVFFTIHPITGEFWGADMGRDWLGDNLPPDEINILKAPVPSTGLRVNNYGWPICYGKNIHDTNFDPAPSRSGSYGASKNTCDTFEPSFIDIPAHSAPLGLAFFPEEGWPEEYWFDLLVAFHGSWNRSVPTGYKVVRYDFDKDGKTLLGVQDFLTGFLSQGGALGRPVDILIQPGGTILISDDKAGAIYRVIYREDS